MGEGWRQKHKQEIERHVQEGQSMAAGQPGQPDGKAGVGQGGTAPPLHTLHPRVLGGLLSNWKENETEKEQGSRRAVSPKFPLGKTARSWWTPSP